MKNRKNLLENLEKSIQYCNNIVFDTSFKSRVFRVLRNPIKFLIRKIDIKILKRKIAIPVKGKVFWGEKINMFSFEQGLYLCGFINHDPEIRLTKFFIKNIKENTIFFDVGSHHGFYSLLVNKISDGKTKIFSFEPSPVHFKVLEKNVSKYQNIKANKFALSSDEGEIEFFENKKGVSTMKKSSASKQEEQGHNFEKIKVKTKTLDKYCSEKGIYPDIIKIDVEGAEIDVLKGSIKLMERKNPLIAIEIWGNKLQNKTHIEVINLLKKLDYKPYKILKDGSVEMLENINIERDVDKELQFDNFVFKRQ